MEGTLTVWTKDPGIWQLQQGESELTPKSHHLHSACPGVPRPHVPLPSQ